jgi:multicomponent Na+:H+ antiporter subunit B
MTDSPKTGMTLIVKTVTRLTVGLILLFGIYVILHGHLSPGGGFAGGVVVALAFVHLMLAFGKDVAASKISKNVASNLESIGALMFLGVALLGFLGGSFFLNILGKGRAFKLFSAGTIPLSNISIGIKVGVGLLAIFLALVILEGTQKKE